MTYNRVVGCYGPFVARLLIAAIFILSGVQKLMGFEGTAGFIASVGLPFASLLAALAIIVELGGGLSILFNYKVRYGAWALFVFTGLATVLFHVDFADQTQMIMFMKNLAIMGGLLLLALCGCGNKDNTCCGGKCRTAKDDEHSPKE